MVEKFLRPPGRWCVSTAWSPHRIRERFNDDSRRYAKVGTALSRVVSSGVLASHRWSIWKQRRQVETRKSDSFRFWRVLWGQNVWREISAVMNSLLG